MARGNEVPILPSELEVNMVFFLVVALHHSA